jgi:hypothetical protein
MTQIPTRAPIGTMVGVFFACLLFGGPNLVAVIAFTDALPLPGSLGPIYVLVVVLGAIAAGAAAMHHTLRHLTHGEKLVFALLATGGCGLIWLAFLWLGLAYFATPFTFRNIVEAFATDPVSDVQGLGYLLGRVMLYALTHLLICFVFVGLGARVQARLLT